jgi:hypothetical protein
MLNKLGSADYTSAVPMASYNNAPPPPAPASSYTDERGLSFNHSFHFLFMHLYHLLLISHPGSLKLIQIQKTCVLKK